MCFIKKFPPLFPVTGKRQKPPPTNKSYTDVTASLRLGHLRGGEDTEGDGVSRTEGQHWATCCYSTRVTSLLRSTAGATSLYSPPSTSLFPGAQALSPTLHSALIQPHHLEFWFNQGPANSASVLPPWGPAGSTWKALLQATPHSHREPRGKSGRLPAVAPGPPYLGQLTMCRLL